VTLIQEITALMVNYQAYASGNFLTDFDDVSDAIDAGDDAPEDQTIYTALNNVQNAMGSVWSAMLELARSAAPALGRLASCPNLNDPQLCLDYFVQYMVDNSETILDGGIEKDTSTSITGTSAGAGACKMLSTDINSNKIDVGHTEDLTLFCIRDYSQGSTAGAELFEIRGEDNSGKRPWEEGGSGTNGASYDYPYGNVRADFGPDIRRAVSGASLAAIGPSSSAGNLISNGDFESAISGTGSTKLPSWTISSGDTAVSQITAATSSNEAINGTYSIEVNDNFKMDHFFSQGRLKPRTAYGLAVKLTRKTSADGTLTVKIMDADEGTTHATLTQAVGSLSNDTVTLVSINPFLIPDNAEDLKVQVQLASNTTGELIIDDVMCGPATLVDGYFLAIYDGTYLNTSGYAQGRFKNGDQFVIQTTAGTAGEGEIQEYFVNRPWGRYFPSDESPTWADPA